MVFSSRTNRTASKNEVTAFGGDGGKDSCPLLGEDEMLNSEIQSERIRDVRRIDNGILRSKRSVAQRIRIHKNRFAQRILVACRLADRSIDQTFTQEKKNNDIAIERLTKIRGSLLAHSQSTVGKSE